MLNLVSKKSDKTFDDTLEDMGGYCLFNVAKYKHEKHYPFLKEATSSAWREFANRFYSLEKKPIYVRFIDPVNPRFGSIALVKTYTASSWSSAYSKPDYQRHADYMTTNKHVSGEVRWEGRNSSPWIYSTADLMEFLPDYEGPTVWQYDKERSQRVTKVDAKDRLGRVIQVGDFCTYILYQFTGPSSAGIYFGNVTKVTPDGQVFLKNISLANGEPSKEKPVKDNSLITILTDDLMNQLMLAKLRT